MVHTVTGWWRRNALPLTAVVVLVPALAVTVGWNEWSAANAGRASFPVTVAPGDSTPFGEATVGPVTAEFVDDPLAPEDARVVWVQVEIDPGETALSCFTPKLRETGGDRRQWEAASSELERSWESDLPRLCDSEATEPYTLGLAYVVPRDADGPFAVEVASASLLPSFVSAVVEP